MKFIVMIIFSIVCLFGCSGKKIEVVQLTEDEKKVLNKLVEINNINQKKIKKLEMKLKKLKGISVENRHHLGSLGVKVKYEPIDVSKLNIVTDQPNGPAPKKL